MVTVRRVLAWGCLWVHVVSGCGGRTLAGGDGDAGEDEEGGSTAGSTAASAGRSESQTGSGAGSSGVQPFFVCPASPPAKGSVCDSPQRICVYPAPEDCQSFVCSPSGGWQPSHEGC